MCTTRGPEFDPELHCLDFFRYSVSMSVLSFIPLVCWEWINWCINPVRISLIMWPAEVPVSAQQLPEQEETTTETAAGNLESVGKRHRTALYNDQLNKSVHQNVLLCDDLEHRWFCQQKQWVGGRCSVCKGPSQDSSPTTKHLENLSFQVAKTET